MRRLPNRMSYIAETITLYGLKEPLAPLSINGKRKMASKGDEADGERACYPFPVDDPAVYKELVRGIDSLDWRTIWQRLRSFGWRFDYEKPSANPWFLAPGQDISTAVAGKGKFAESEQVCIMLKTQFPVKHIAIFKGMQFLISGVTEDR